MARTVPSLVTQNPGTIITGALWNNGPKASGDFMTTPPLFKGRQSSIQTAPNVTWWSVSMQVNDEDTDNGHSTVTNNTRYTCQVSGWYYVKGFTSWDVTAGQTRMDAVIAKNNVAINGSSQSLVKTAGEVGAISAEAFVHLLVGDYVEIWGFQNSGGSVNTADSTDSCPALVAWWIHG